MRRAILLLLALPMLATTALAEQGALGQKDILSERVIADERF